MDKVSQERAIEIAQQQAAQANFDSGDCEVNALEADGQWTVDFVPKNDEQLGGGYRVVINADNGEVVDQGLAQ